MLEFLTLPGVAIFSGALLLMLALGIVEAAGLSASAVDVDLDLDGGWLAWLGIGTLPLLVLLVSFFAAFGVIGLVGQQAMVAVTGRIAPPLLSIPVALAASLPATALLARGLGRVLPRDETTAFERERLVGLSAAITVGRAEAGSPARARVVDPHGQAHHVLVAPHDPEDRFTEGTVVLLVRREGEQFFAVPRDPPSVLDWKPR